MIEYTFFENNLLKGRLNEGLLNNKVVFSAWSTTIFCYSLENSKKLIAQFRLKSKTK